MALQLHLAGDAIYRQKMRPIEAMTDEVKATVAELLKALHDYHAIGIAAPMFGIDMRIILVLLDDQPTAMLNPEIISRSEQQVLGEEASIPYPGISADVLRPAEVTVRYLNLQGETVERPLSGLNARVVQHELEYLNNQCFLDHLSRLKRDMLLRKAQKNIRAGHVPHVHSEFCNH